MGRIADMSPTRKLIVSTVVAVGSWAAFSLLFPLPFIGVLYYVGGLTSLDWAVLFLIVASAAALFATGYGLRLMLAKVRNLFVRVACWVVGGTAWLAAACCLGLICLSALLGVFLEASHTVVIAEDGTALMVTRDSFDGDIVDLYEPRNLWTWTRRSDLMGVDPRSGPCSLHMLDADLFRLTCGETSQDLTRH